MPSAPGQRSTLTQAQQRVLACFRGNTRRKSHPDYWSVNDTLPLRALIAKGLIEYELGCYRDDYYRVTPLGRAALESS